MTPTDQPSAEPTHSCCAPSPTDLGTNRSGLPLAGRKVASSIGTDRHRIGQSVVPAGNYLMGDEPLDPDTDAWRCNIWQGRFPTDNDLSDGYLTTAPVRTYAPNAYGLWPRVEQ